jgi:hypothetical protein
VSRCELGHGAVTDPRESPLGESSIPQKGDLRSEESHIQRPIKDGRTQSRSSIGTAPDGPFATVKEPPCTRHRAAITPRPR